MNASGAETSLGRGPRDFTATAWSAIILGGEASSAQRRTRLERLARQYWRPVYVYVRTRWKRSNEEAKDLTQKFFLWMIETDFLSKVRADRGRFRNFLRTALERFLSGEYDAARRLKRGGDRPQASLDFILESGGEPEAPGDDPQAALDEQWRRVLIESAMQRLRDYYRSEGKEVQFSVFEDFYLAPEPGPSHDETARRHGISTTDVANYLSRAKVRFRAFLEDGIADSVGSSEDLRGEFDELFPRK